MIVQIFKCANDETPIEIEIANVDVSRVIPFNANVGERISKEKLELLLNELGFTEDINMDEPEIYFAQQVSVWLDDDTVLGYRTPFDIPHHIAVRVVLESILKKLELSDSMQIRIY